MDSLAGGSTIRTGLARAGMAAIAAIGWPTMAAACTLCASAAGISIRARLFGPDLWWQAGAVLAPLVLLGLLILLAARGPWGDAA